MAFSDLVFAKIHALFDMSFKLTLQDSIETFEATYGSISDDGVEGSEY